MNEIIVATISILGPIVSGFIAYGAAVKKANVNLEIVKENNKKEIVRMERAHELEMEKMQAQLDAELKRVEYGAGMDVIKEVLKSPEMQKEMARQMMASKKKRK